MTLPDPGGKGVYGVAFTSNGTLATGDLDGSAFLWNIAKAKVTHTFSDSNGQAIFGVAVTPDGAFLAADTANAPVYSKGGVVLWDTSESKPVHILTAPSGQQFGNPPAFSPDGETVAAASADFSIYRWNLTTGKLVGKPLTDPESQGDYGIAFSPTTGFLAAGDQNGTAYLWDTKRESIVRSFPDPESEGVRSVAFSPDGSVLATGDNNGNVYLWDPATSAPSTLLRGPKGGTIQSIAFSPRGGMIAATSDNDKQHDYVTCIWDPSGKVLYTFHDPKSESMTKLAFSPDGSVLAVGDENNNTYIWDMNGLNP